MIKKIIVYDPIVGRSYEGNPETRQDLIAATISVVYLLTMLILLSWLLADICVGKGKFIAALAGNSDVPVDTGLLRLILYTIVGGGLGGTLNGIRSLLFWHAEQRMFGWRYVWKYVSAPLVGGVLAAITYAIVQGGIVAFAGDTSGNAGGATQGLAAFAIGALAGYGSHTVFQWLDAQVKRLFSAAQGEINVPDLSGKTKEEAQSALLELGLLLGQVSHQKTIEPDNLEKVIEQNPAAHEKVPLGTCVDITLGEGE